MEELQQHQGEWFFLHELNVDKVFSTIQRADYLILYYIKVEQEAHPGEKLYLADLAAAMGLRVTELSKGIEKLQDSGFVTWKTDREAGRTYVELSSGGTDGGGAGAFAALLPPDARRAWRRRVAPRRCHHAARHRYPEGRAGEGVPGSAITIMKERYRTAL
jgi:DNA-binding MarR family transcriptional regulator